MIRTEQHRGVVDDAVQDLVQVQPAADVAGDAPQRVGALELVGDLRGRVRRANDVAEGGRCHPDQVALSLGEGLGRWADHQQDAPRLQIAGDRTGHLVARLVRRREVVRRASLDDHGWICECPPEHAERRRQLRQPVARRSRGRRGRQARVVDLPGGHMARPQRLANRAHRGGKGHARIGQGVADRGAAQRRELTHEREHGLVFIQSHDGAPSTLRSRPQVIRGRRLAGVEAGEEPLEVAEPVAPIAARVDPVIPQPPGIAPRPHRVGVDAQHLGRARDAERRVERPGMVQVELRQSTPPVDS